MRGPKPVYPIELTAKEANTCSPITFSAPATSNALSTSTSRITTRLPNRSTGPTPSRNANRNLESIYDRLYLAKHKEYNLCSILSESISLIKMSGEHLGELIQQRLPASLMVRTHLLAAEAFMGQDDFSKGTVLDKFDRDYCFQAQRC